MFCRRIRLRLPKRRLDACIRCISLRGGLEGMCGGFGGSIVREGREVEFRFDACHNLIIESFDNGCNIVGVGFKPMNNYLFSLSCLHLLKSTFQSFIDWLCSLSIEE